MGVFDKFKGAGARAKSAFEKAEAKFDNALEKGAIRAKASRAKNKKRKEQISTILGTKGRSKPSGSLGLSSKPFSTETSRPSFGTARNVIYGDPEPKKPKKRTVKLTFED